MIRGIALLALLLSSAPVAYPETQLPESDDYQSFEVEPPILLPNRQVEAEATPADSKGLNHDPAVLEKRVELAKRSAAEAEQLFKRGVLSRVEVELRVLRIVRLQSDLENARLERAKADLAVQQTRLEMREISKAQLAVFDRAVQAATETAEAAVAARDRAEIAAAETNLRRQQKLAHLGSARPSDVARAEQKLADLKAAKN
jgi:hypothetical protein